MTDPVNTDALRAIAEGFAAKGWVHNAKHCRAAADEVDRLRAELDAWEPTWRYMRDERNAARQAWEETESARAAAAAYGDKLRAAIENAPHEYTCYAGKLAVAKCTCWKADAL